MSMTSENFFSQLLRLASGRSSSNGDYNDDLQGKLLFPLQVDLPRLLTWGYVIYYFISFDASLGRAVNVVDWFKIVI